MQPRSGWLHVTAANIILPLARLTSGQLHRQRRLSIELARTGDQLMYMSVVKFEPSPHWLAEQTDKLLAVFGLHWIAYRFCLQICSCSCKLALSLIESDMKSRLYAQLIDSQAGSHFWLSHSRIQPTLECPVIEPPPMHPTMTSA